MEFRTNKEQFSGNNFEFTRIRKRLFFLGLLLFPLLVFLLLFVFVAYRPNVNFEPGKESYIYIRNNDTFEKVVKNLKEHNILKTEWTFRILAQKKNYPEKIKPGRYLIRKSMSNNSLINLLRSGKQEAMNVVIRNFNTIHEMAGSVSKSIEADSAGIVNLLFDKNFCLENGVNPRYSSTYLIADTYKFFWNTPASDFLKRMFREYRNFWNEERKKQAEEIGLTRHEVAILASIVEKETSKRDEMQRIAGVYMNRLRNGWPLQADPTLVFASTDFGTNRVTKKHIDVDSPYNTYQNPGLPPGPICIPSAVTLDAVLNYESHRYFYFVAKDDLTGYHQFSRSLDEHNLYAAKYRKAIKKLRK